MIYEENDDFEVRLKKMFRADEDCFEAFKSKAALMGYDLVSVIVIPTSKSCYAVQDFGGNCVVPYLKIVTGDQKNYDRVKHINEGSGLVHNKAAEVLREIWHEVCLAYKLNSLEVFHKKMYIGVERAEVIAYTYFARNDKELIRKTVREVIGCEPQNIYASSMPSVNIVFSKENYHTYKIEEKQHILIQRILSVSSARINQLVGDYWIDNVLQVTCWHPDMPYYSGYGLARED